MFGRNVDGERLAMPRFDGNGGGRKTWRNIVVAVLLALLAAGAWMAFGEDILGMAEFPGTVPATVEIAKPGTDARPAPRAKPVADAREGTGATGAAGMADSTGMADGADAMAASAGTGPTPPGDATHQGRINRNADGLPKTSAGIPSHVDVSRLSELAGIREELKLQREIAALRKQIADARKGSEAKTPESANMLDPKQVEKRIAEERARWEKERKRLDDERRERDRLTRARKAVNDIVVVSVVGSGSTLSADVKDGAGRIARVRVGGTLPQGRVVSIDRRGVTVEGPEGPRLLPFEGD
jgi:hypothetical protein